MASAIRLGLAGEVVCNAPTDTPASRATAPVVVRA